MQKKLKPFIKMITKHSNSTSCHTNLGRVLLYAGPGSDDYCVEKTHSFLKQHLDPGHSIVRYPSSILRMCQAPMDPKSIQAIIVPGGNLPTMCDFEEWDPAIRSSFKVALLANRISYYGVCAGAMLGTSKVYGRNISRDSFQEFIKPRFSNETIGPLSLAPIASFAPLFPRSAPGIKDIVDRHLIELDHETTPGKFVMHVLGPIFSPLVRYNGLTQSYFYERCQNIEKLHVYPSTITRPQSFGTDCVKIDSSKDSENFENAETIAYQYPEGSCILLTGCHREFNEAPLFNGPLKIHSHPNTLASYDEKDALGVANELLKQSQLLRENDTRSHLKRLGLKLAK